jgi:asparagine synthase (glutamine-hydrolysing)
MCGICGIVGMESAEESARAVRRMTAALVHRGPDEDGFLIAPQAAPRVALGMRRLSIIDLPGGTQPIFNETGDVAVFQNGEIYNFRQLRAELETLGHVFRTRSDTEVIVHGYEQWGDDCAKHLRGMFAFALLDMRVTSIDGAAGAPKVLLARDRLGIKPLYYALRDGILYFSSEVRALLAGGCVPRRISAGALDSYLLFGSVCEPMTMVEEVYSLPPGHCASLRASGSVQWVAPVPYWEFGDAASRKLNDVPSTLEAAAARLRPVLNEAVADHLIADVPLGIFLSSGLDSTAIVALASAAQAGLHTFTVIFPEQEFSEAEPARATAKRFGTHHEELLLDGAEMLAHLDDAVDALDQPSMNGINTYFVSWAAKRAGLKVALSGLGGDELFGGYSTFASGPRAVRVAALGEKFSRGVRKATASAVGRAGGGRGDAGRKLAALWRNSGAFPHPYYFMRTLYTPDHVSALRGANATSGDDRLWRDWMADTSHQADMLDSFNAISCLEARSYMVNTLLRDTDSVSMAHSLEVRVPLLDHVLVEFVSRLPAEVKVKRGVNKALLVEALKGLLPSETLSQRKRTFTFPWERWLRGSLAPRVSAGLGDPAPALAPHLNADAVRAVWLVFEASKTNWSRPWSLYVLNQWCRKHLEAQPGEEMPAVKTSSVPGSR